MNEPASALSAWESFYVIVGSSGGALIGLQFVVITLIAERRTLASSDSIAAFGTPTVVHLAAALVIAAVMSAPWHSLVPPAIAMAVCGVVGLAYGVVVIRRAKRQTTYKPVWEDWLWFAVLPCSMYGALAITAMFLFADTEAALRVIGTAALALLLIGIHNAWDSVTHIVVSAAQRE